MKMLNTNIFLIITGASYTFAKLMLLFQTASLSFQKKMLPTVAVTMLRKIFHQMGNMKGLLMSMMSSSLN